MARKEGGREGTRRGYRDGRRGRSAWHASGQVANRGAASPFLSDKDIPWHSDLSYRAAPGSLGALYAVTVPAAGSWTYWADCAAAYDALDTGFQRDIEHLQAVHRHPEPHMNAVEDAEVRHPVVRVHPETGRRSIFVSPYFTVSIVGLCDMESEQVLQRLNEAVTDNAISYKHEWRPGQLVLYDNRSTNHMRPAFKGERLLWRTQAREPV